jgi:hypothetical protein
MLTGVAALKPVDRKRWQALATAVLSERTKFTSAKWLPHFKRLRLAIQRHRHVLEVIGAPPGAGDPEPRELLVWAWCVLMAAPKNTSQFYTRIRETTDDGRGLQDEARQLRSRAYAMRGLETSPEMQMRWLGGLVRAIDADIAGLDEWPRPLSEWSSDDWRPAGYPCFVIPVRREFRAEEGKERERRGMLQHAIVPAMLGELEVHLALHPDVNPKGSARAWTYGAAVFDGLTIDVDRIGDDAFRVADAPLHDESGVLAEHLEQALSAECDVLAWPELTVPPERLQSIRAALKRDPLADRRRIPLSVAGSWHVEIDGRRVNRTEILQGRGRPLASYDKRREFTFERRHEEILAGERLLVIVTEERLISVAICLDFCDDCADDVYDWLNVDLVLVPSMGDVKTLEAQHRSAKGMQSRQGAVTFLVQQVPVETGTALNEGAPAAYSFASPPQEVGGKAVQPPADRQDEPFRAIRARR